MQLKALVSGHPELEAEAEAVAAALAPLEPRPKAATQPPS
eukprot:SAG22_NODE_12075_length_457_cov_0.941341_1_plen_39_part_01